ncbi:MAG TPA: hypothetical protein VM915_13570 [Verrucomicrobiae bacterium]|nr:hypothetical protein [Verrucomicrobiae bacterium]
MTRVDAAALPEARPDRPPPAGLVDQRTRALLQVGQARVSNAWLRLGSCAIVAVVAMSILGNLWPIAWWVGLCVVLFLDRALYRALLQAIDAGAKPSMTGLVVWTVAQSIYGNLLAVMLWFAPYVPGESLAVIYLCGGLANAIATLRAHAGLTLAGAGSLADLLEVERIVLGRGQASSRELSAPISSPARVSATPAGEETHFTLREKRRACVTAARLGASRIPTM